MEDFLRSNEEFLIKELESRSIPLSEDAKKIADFTINPTDEFKEIDGVYYYPYYDGYIPFRLLSDGKVTEIEIEILRSAKRENCETSRSLRIAASHLLPDAIYMVVLSDSVKSLVKYYQDGCEYIIDYCHNVIMKREDYKKIFPYEVIEEIDQANLSYCSELIKKLGSSISVPLILIFFKEIMDNIKKRVSTFAQERFMSGIHWRNRYLLSLSDELLFSTYDEKISFGEFQEHNAIFDFTLDPLAKRYDITITDDDYFLYKDYRFRRISDYVEIREFKEKLVTSERFHMCMAGSIWMALILARKFDEKDIRIVLGVTPMNEYEGFYHVVVEFKEAGKWKIMDYTGNVIMESDDYIRLREMKVMMKIDYSIIKELGNFYHDSKLEMDIFPIIYFAEEMLRDIKKSAVLSKKLED